MHKRLCFLPLIIGVAATGCAPHNHNAPEPVHPADVACQDNAFLKKYHCDINKMELMAERGDADAQYALGYMYFYGINTVQDEYAGVAWMRAAAGQGQTSAIKATNMLDLYWYPRMGRIARLHRS